MYRLYIIRNENAFGRAGGRQPAAGGKRRAGAGYKNKQIEISDMCSSLCLSDVLKNMTIWLKNKDT